MVVRCPHASLAACDHSETTVLCFALLCFGLLLIFDWLLLTTILFFFFLLARVRKCECILFFFFCVRVFFVLRTCNGSFVAIIIELLSQRGWMGLPQTNRAVSRQSVTVGQSLFVDILKCHTLLVVGRFLFGDWCLVPDRSSNSCLFFLPFEVDLR